MLKKTFEYEDYEGNKIKQDEYFHLSEAELTEMTLSEKGGLDKLLQKIVDAKAWPFPTYEELLFEQ